MSEDMEEYKASFDIESKTDAYAVERLTGTLYDSIREEARTIREDTADSTEMLEQFRSIRDAARKQTPGRLRVVYEQHEGEFDA